ncbi:MFS family permease [Nocardioides sp. BE266]|uniref:MFS transporter n=1 Tax=Nocardioides sp. BE266 TaxID=2817725 RepID=UPI002861CA4F|nr:MFS transporter [Nocardioides sp. BE266]MDR7254217.1 MFS family permease [Nocardioides sp. BE266]
MGHRSWMYVAPAAFVLSYGGNQFTPLLAMYRDLAGYSSAEVNLFLAMYVVGLVPGFLVVGQASLRWGRRRVMLAGLVTGLMASGVLAASLNQPAFLCIGRLLVGVSVAIALVVGTAWIDDLTPPTAARGTAARRAAMTLTAGFGAGAGVAGTLAQWGPSPHVTPYVVHLVLGALAMPSLVRAPDPAQRTPGSRLAPDLRLPGRSRHRFDLVVLTTAPWVFASAGLAYAIVPELVATRTASLAVAFATLLTVLMLGSGVLAQRVAGRLHVRLRGWELVLGMSLMTAGAAMVALETAARSLVLAVGAAVVLGAAYGVTVVAGLVEVRAMAAAEQLPGLTGIFYALTYVGFALPAALATVEHAVSYAASLTLVSLACATCTAVAAVGLRSTRPAWLDYDERAGSPPVSSGKSSSRHS